MQKVNSSNQHNGVYISMCASTLGFLLFHLTYFKCFRRKLSAPCKFHFATSYYKGNTDGKVRQTGPDCLKVQKMNFSSLVRWQKSLLSPFSRWQKTIKQSVVLQKTFILWSKTPNSWYENKVQRPNKELHHGRETTALDSCKMFKEPSPSFLKVAEKKRKSSSAF